MNKKHSYYGVYRVNNGERRDFYGRLFGGTCCTVTVDLDEAREIAKRMAEDCGEDSLTSFEVVSCDDDGTMIEIV